MILAVLQASPTAVAAPAQVRGDRFQIIVPQGWKTLIGGGDVVLEHTTGASLLVRRISAAKSLATYARQQAERVMAPLGFAKLGESRDFRDTRDEWVEYEIIGNRLTEHRRILYRALRRNTAYYEFVFEASENNFDLLLSEAHTMASSVQTIIEAPRVRRVRR
jgi:hypothetical protein